MTTGPNAPPLYPYGPFAAAFAQDNGQRPASIRQLAAAPARLRQAVAGLDTAALDTKYRNWTIRQIVHRLADSHVNSYIRFKWTLTEDRPTIKAYDEELWSGLTESRHGAIEPSLALVDGLHARWVQLLQTLSDDQFHRCFVHPQSGETISLQSALSYYAWHGSHHIAQIEWLRALHGW